jgi:hypothetical protein
MRCHCSGFDHPVILPLQLVTYHSNLSPVTCHLSPVTCHLSPVTCHLMWGGKKVLKIPKSKNPKIFKSHKIQRGQKFGKSKHLKILKVEKSLIFLKP